MVGPDLQTVVHRLHRLASEGGAGCAPDAELLGRFVAGRDAASFELLVWRHGAMVLATCRRILGHGPDAEDAFQATFLALVRQARSVRNTESLGPWLHRVARRASLHARRRNLRRERIERSLAVAPPVSPAEPSDVRAVVDEEVDRLSERLRRVVVLCYLEGHTTEDAARLLGVPRGTVLSRLARARDRLRGEFVRRGLAPAAGLVAVTTGDALAVPLVETSVQNALNLINGSAAVAPAVAALTEGVVRSMVLGKLKVTAAGLILGLAILGTGTILVSKPSLKAQPPGSTDKAEKPDANKPAEPRSRLDVLFPKDNRNHDSEIKRLQRTWKVDKIIERGNVGNEEGMRWTFGPTSLTVLEGKGGPTVTMSYRFDESAQPKTIDLTHGDKTMAGIYRFTAAGDKFSLHVCLPNGKGPRPASFESTKEVTLFVLVPIEDKAERGQPADANELDALKRENQRLLDQLAANTRQQRELQARAVDMERSAIEQRTRAEAERQLALKEVQAVAAKLERALKEKDAEMELLRAKVPLDKWDSGWSEVKLEIEGGWGLRILADGSGIYGVGGNFHDFCTFPAGTFAFDKVRRDVLARAKLDQNNASCMIDLRRKNEPGSVIAYSNDGAFMIGLLQTAHAKATTPSLDEHWAKNPPQPLTRGQPSKAGAKP